MTLWVGARHGKSLACQIWCLQALWKWRYEVFSWRARFHMPLLNSAITVYFWCTWHVIVTHTRFQDVDTSICQCVQWRTFDIGHICLQQQLTQTTYKTICISIQKQRRKGKWEETKNIKKTRMPIVELFALHASTK